MIDLNSAGADELEQAGLRFSLCSALLTERDLKGPFESWPDVERRVKGIGPRTVAKLQHSFALQPGSQQGKEREKHSSAVGPGRPHLPPDGKPAARRQQQEEGQGEEAPRWLRQLLGLLLLPHEKARLAQKAQREHRVVADADGRRKPSRPAAEDGPDAVAPAPFWVLERASQAPFPLEFTERVERNGRRHYLYDHFAPAGGSGGASARSSRQGGRSRQSAPSSKQSAHSVEEQDDLLEYGGRTYTLQEAEQLRALWHRRYPRLEGTGRAGNGRESLRQKEHAQQAPANRQSAWEELLRFEATERIPVRWRALFRSDAYGNVVSLAARGSSACAFELDHAFPWCRGGLSTPDNFVALFWGANRFIKRSQILNALTEEETDELQCGLSVTAFLQLLRQLPQLLPPGSWGGRRRQEAAALQALLCEPLGAAWNLRKACPEQANLLQYFWGLHCASAAAQGVVVTGRTHRFAAAA